MENSVLKNLKLSKPKPKPKTETKSKTPVNVEPKKRKGRTLTGKAAAIIDTEPRMKIIDSIGRPIHESVAVIVWGRMNPPTIGHERLVQEAYETAIQENGIPLLFLSNSVNAKNPLEPEVKLQLVEEAFGDNIFIIPESVSNPINVLKLVSETFNNIVWITGDDQFDDYVRILEDYNGKEFEFQSYKVVGLDRDQSSANLLESVSASQLRQAAIDNDIETFTQGLASNLQDVAEEVMHLVRDAIVLIESNKS